MINACIYIDDGEDIPSEEIFRFLEKVEGISSVECILSGFNLTGVRGGHIGCTDECDIDEEGNSISAEDDDYITHKLSLDGYFYDSINEVLYEDFVEGVTDMEITDGTIYYCERCGGFGGFIYTEELD